MYQFIETIKFQHGTPQHLIYHQQRFDDTRWEYYGTKVSTILLHKLLRFPALDAQTTYKCTLVYDSDIQSISIRPYQVKKINQLQTVLADQISYESKFLDRLSLSQCFNQRDEADDVIIIRNGWVTDSYYANLVFENEEGLFTPAHALLKGTTRARLLDEKVIKERQIHLDDIKLYKSVYLINAMIPLGGVSIDTARIII